MRTQTIALLVALVLTMAFGVSVALATPNDHPSNKGQKLWNAKEVRFQTGYKLVSCQFKRVGVPKCVREHDPSGRAPQGFKCKEPKVEPVPFKDLPSYCEELVVGPTPLPDECRR
jgi:hypothetical protein